MLDTTVWQRAEDAVVAGDVTTLDRLLLDHGESLRKERPQSSWSGGLTPQYDAPNARAIIAANHHFISWGEYAAFDDARAQRNSPVARFEAAVDAIVSGDAATLEALLREDPELIRARSTRTHHSTLLHYVGANGVEGFRQRTPKNAVDVAKVLLDAGAEVDAAADMYGGGSTTLGLVATSIHPKLAGLQNELIDVLLLRGAAIDNAGAAGNRHPLVPGCLANGRPEAAEYLARRGAPLDLASAAGIGWLDVVKSYFEPDGNLKASATRAQMEKGFSLACGYGRAPVVDFLLDRGMKADAWLKDHGSGHSGLHVAAYGGHVDIVKTLLRRGAPVDVTDDTWGTTPLIWALHAWSESPMAPPERYHEVVALLVAAGSVVKPEWLDWDKVRADPGMLAALTG